MSKENDNEIKKDKCMASAIGDPARSSEPSMWDFSKMQLPAIPEMLAINMSVGLPLMRLPQMMSPSESGGTSTCFSTFQHASVFM